MLYLHRFALVWTELAKKKKRMPFLNQKMVQICPKKLKHYVCNWSIKLALTGWFVGIRRLVCTSNNSLLFLPQTGVALCLILQQWLLWLVLFLLVDSRLDVYNNRYCMLLQEINWEFSSFFFFFCPFILVSGSDFSSWFEMWQVPRQNSQCYFKS